MQTLTLADPERAGPTHTGAYLSNLHQHEWDMLGFRAENQRRKSPPIAVAGQAPDPVGAFARIAP